jgi:periplasmic serine protease, Do/DeqQ family
MFVGFRSIRSQAVPGTNFLLISAIIAVTLTISAETAAGQATGNVQVSPAQLSATFADIAKRVEPAVVNIETKGRVPDVPAKTDGTPADPDDIMDFFRRQLPRRPSYAVGSGFILDKSGLIMTNAHVIEGAARITVKLDSDEEYPATIVGSDELTDLAVLKIDAGKELPFVKLGNSDNARVGDWVLALGSPFGLSKSVTAGIVSQTHRDSPQGSAFQKFIQTDAAINKGNSGGPLVNMDGEVIGINSQIATSSGDSNGVGFAFPANEAASVYKQLVSSGKVRRGYLGVALESVKAEYAKIYGLKDAKGAIVTDIRDKQGSAATTGLKVGDVITDFDGHKVENARDLIAKVSSATPGQDVHIDYLRENGTAVEKKSAVIKLGERRPLSFSETEEDKGKTPIGPTRDDQKPFGLTLTELTPTLATNYKLEGQKGLVVKEVNPASYIADVKMSNGDDALDEGDLIQRINRSPVTTLKAFNETVAKLKPGDAVVLEVLAYSRLSRSTQLKIVQFTVQ